MPRVVRLRLTKLKLGIYSFHRSVFDDLSLNEATVFSNPSKALQNEISILHNYYKPQMEKVYKMIYPTLPVSDFCQNESRYQWLKSYLCENLA